MKKLNLMKYCKLIVIALIGIVATKTISVNATTSAPSSITMGTHASFSNYIGTISTSYKRTSDGTFIYCIEYPKIAPTTGSTLNKGAIMDAGMAYIIANGYPTKTLTGDNYRDYYITQLAIWWYMDIATGKSTPNLSRLKDGTTYKANSTYPYVVNLKNGAVAAAKTGYATPSIKINLANNSLTLDSTGKYYVSEAIGVTASSVAGNYTVALTNAPAGTIVEGTNGTKTTTFAQNAKFVVKVPVAKITELSTSFDIKVSATGSVNKAQLYSVSDESIQKVVISKLYPETNNVSANTNLKVSSDQIKINKIDSATKKNIAGATLAIKDSTGKVIKKWETTSKAEVITNLPAGKYTLYEVTAPAGYEKTTKTYSFEVSNTGKITTIDVPNIELVKTAQIEISKQDITTKKELPGAKLTIKDSKGKVVETWVSTNEPHYITLEVGKYTLIEESAPDGYELSSEKIEFEVTGKEEIIKKVMYNTPIPEQIVEVPKTGVNSTILYTVTICIVALGLGLVYKYGKASK